jgi:RNA polymerase sigma factor (sigma-70 family)
MGSISSSERGSYRYAGRDDFRRIEEKSMQNTNPYVATEEREESPNEGKAAQQLEQILASGLPPLYRRAYRILGNAAEAEDAVQDALLAAYTHLHQFRGQAQISTWLTTIMLNCARLQLRRPAKHVQMSLDDSTGGPQPVSASERLADHRPNPEDEYLILAGSTKELLDEEDGRQSSARQHTAWSA